MHARQIRTLIAATGLGALLLCPMPTFAQSYYRWVDDAGKVHYSDQRPGAGRSSQSLRRESLSAAELVSRTNRRNAAQPMQNWADSTRRFAPRAVAPDAPAFSPETLQRR